MTGPAFLRHLTEEGRPIGFVLEYVEGRYTAISDLDAYEPIFTKNHRLGLLHGDLNKYNFLITERDAVLVDFETMQQSEDKKAMQNELESLKEQLLDDPENGGVVLVNENGEN
jgi:tRNA A-37 threonylcarbamoyl transferase component Bud32